MVQERDLSGIINPELELLGFECVKLEVVGSPCSPVVRLYIDKPGGVTVGECAKVAGPSGWCWARIRFQVGTCSVSSPGNNRPLVTEEHYQRFVGQDVRVAVERGEAGRITYRQDSLLYKWRSHLETDDGDVVGPCARWCANLINQNTRSTRKNKDRPTGMRRGEER
jgi:ribosome maturation factor RimP